MITQQWEKIKQGHERKYYPVYSDLQLLPGILYGINPHSSITNKLLTKRTNALGFIITLNKM